MRRKLLLLNLALLGLTAAAAWRWREQWLWADARERAVLKRPVKPAPPAPAPARAAAQPLVPANYIDIAQKTLFSKDRNPVVVVETAPPAPKPMPPLPILHGVLDLGDGPSVILSEKKDGQHRDFRPGDQIGEFKLVAVNNQEIVFEWDGKTVRKNLEDLVDRSSPSPAPTEARSAATPAQAAPPPPSGQPAPGVDIGKGVRACQPGDASAPGTVVDGMRKVVTESPFGSVCRWEPVK